MRPAPSLLPRHRCFLAVFLGVLFPVLCGCNWLSGRQANQVGMIYYRFGNYTAAAHEFHRATIDDPANADYLHNLAAARLKQGNALEAEQNYRKALQVNPGHQPSYHGLAWLLKQQDRTADAMSLLQSWVEIEPYRAEPYIELAWLQRDTGDVNGALLTLQKALPAHPRHPTLLAHLGQIYQDLGQQATAVAMYQRSLYSNWVQPQVHSRLAMLRQRPVLVRGGGVFLGSPVPATALNGMMTTTPVRSADATPAFNADPAHAPDKTARKQPNTASNGNDAPQR